MDDIGAFLTPTIGATGLLVLVVLMVLRGLLVPRRTVDTLLANKDAQIESWKTAHERADATVEAQARQIAALLTTAKTTNRVLEALPEAAGLNSHEGRRDANMAEAPDA